MTHRRIASLSALTLATTVAMTLATSLLTAPHAVAGPPKPRTAPDLTAVAARLIGAAQVQSLALQTVTSLCDSVGHRLAGSPELDRAIAWGTAWMKAHGFVNVRTEPVMVPVWIRGAEHLAVEAPFARQLQVLTLGNSVGTPTGGISADLAVATSFDDLKAQGDRVKGKVVLFDVPFTDYGETVAYRWGAASAAAAQGAVAVLVRSVTPTSLYTAHTGAMGYEDGAPKIPAAAVTIEDATLLHRLVAAAPANQAVRVHLELGAHFLPDAPSANVVGEVRGREHPDEVVLLGCHLDSWDVGQGAQDDGAGCAIVLEAARLIGQLEVQPRRTIRVVLFTNEENGLRGGKGYAVAHAAEAAKHVAVLEADTGSGLPDGFRVQVPRPEPPPAAPGAAPATPPAAQAAPDAKPDPTVAETRILAALRSVADLLAPIRAGGLTLEHAGADIGPMVKLGALGLGLSQDTSAYWPIHHTQADTIDKIDKRSLDLCVATVAVMAYALADMPDRLDTGVSPAPALAPVK